MEADKFTEALIATGACATAIGWCSDKSSDQAWQQVVEPDWMFWFLGNRWRMARPKLTTRAARAIREADGVALARCVCAIARTALHLIPEGEPRPLRAIVATELWCSELRHSDPSGEKHLRPVLRDAEDAMLEAAWVDGSAVAAFGHAAKAVDMVLLGRLTEAVLPATQSADDALDALYWPNELSRSTLWWFEGTRVKQCNIIRSIVPVVEL